MASNQTSRAGLSQLIFIDLQTRLLSAMPQEAMQTVIRNCEILAQAATMLEVPVIVSEQYPKGLGNTAPQLLAFLPNIKPVEKLTFSCMAEPKFSRLLTRDHSQVVIAGMEAHICVLQTALDLQNSKQVFVAEDAIISRNPANKANALARMREAGCIISNTESIVFEWLGKSDSDAFKAISTLVR